MKKEIIEKQLKNWFDQMLQKYTWLNIKYEYNDVEKCFLVSFSPSALTKVSEDFSADALEFENKMNRDYPSDAPLFCDDEDLFELSPNANILPNHFEDMLFMEIQDEDCIKAAHFDFTSLFAQTTSQFSNEELFKDTRYKTKYNKAA